MTIWNAESKQQESVQAQYLAPLIANGTNGQLAVRPVETEIKSELLKFQPNMEEEYVHGLQTKSAIWDHVGFSIPIIFSNMYLIDPM